MRIRLSKKPILAIASFLMVMLTLNFFSEKSPNDPQLVENSEFPQREIEAYSEGIRLFKGGHLINTNDSFCVNGEIYSPGLYAIFR